MEGASVSDAAYESGFNDIGYFRNCFKDEYGVSPSVYAKRLRSKSENSGNTPPFEIIVLIINDIVHNMADIVILKVKSD